ncbi:TPA: DUF551 domain-containing protein [Raoultella ornithinolytica]
MTSKLTITRERLQEIAEDGFLKHGESKILARMALAAMDSEPVAIIDQANLDYLRSGADADVWPPEREEMGDVLLYRHAQPAPVAQKEPISFDEWSRKCALQITLCYPDFREKAQYIWDSAREIQQPAPVVPDDMSIFEAAIEECKTCDSIDEHAWNHGVLAVIAKYESCRAAMLAAAPQSPGSEPATVPGKWIPVSERLPSNEPGSYEYLVYETLNNRVQHDYWNSEGEHSNLESFWNHYGNYVTHWMPLPAAPQEVR